MCTYWFYSHNEASLHGHETLKTLFNIIFLSVPRRSKWSFALRFSHQNPVCTFSLP